MLTDVALQHDADQPWGTLPCPLDGYGSKVGRQGGQGTRAQSDRMVQRGKAQKG